MKKVVVIGGGILGVTAAEHLSSKHFSVVLLERNELMSAASGGNLGQISLSDRTENWHIRLALDTLDEYRRISKGTDLGYREEGGSILIEEDDEFEKAEALKQKMDAHGIHTDILVGNDVLSHIPGLFCKKVKGIFYCSKEGVINPIKTVNYYASRAKKNGARIIEHTSVVGFRMKGRDIETVVTDNGEYPADYVINCAGAWTQKIGEMAHVPISLSWRRGSAMISEPVPVIIRGQMCGHELFGGTSSTLGGDGTQLISFGIVQADNGGVMIAQSTQYTDLEDKAVPIDGMAEVARRFEDHFPEYRGINIIRMWSAVTPFSEDGAPFFGIAGACSNMITAAGFKGAFSTAPMVAIEIGNLIGQGSALSISDLRPDRKIEVVH